MFDVARSISLPAHFVELRHEVAHEDMPGLARLVRCTREAVDWLWGVYWGRLSGDEAQMTDGAGIAGEGKERVRGVLKEFRSERIAGLKAKGKERPNASEFAARIKIACGQCVEICGAGEDKRARWEQLAEVLVDEGLIVPSLKKCVVFVLSVYIKLTDFYRRGPLPDSALQGAYMLWDELLQMLARQSHLFFELFLECAVSHNARFTTSDDDTDKTSPTKWAIYRWILHLLDSSEWSVTRDQSSLDLECIVLRECALYPNNQWSLDLAEEILDDADKQVQSTWSKVVEASALDDEESEGSQAKQGAPEAAGAVADVVMEDTSLDYGGWRQGIQPLKSVPLGMVEN